MLRVSGLETYYGTSQALFGMEFEVGTKEVITLLGRNGMGKTTTINAIMGILRSSSGQVKFEGRDITDLASYKISQLGIGLVPEGRQIFPNLSVLENLISTHSDRNGTGHWTLEGILDMFPELSARLNAMGSVLSGGEQQMLAIGRALMTNPSLLILDEATEGLAPLIRKKIWSCLQSIRAMGLSILIVDKNLTDLLEIADRHYIVQKGKVAWTGSSAELSGDPDLQKKYLGV